MMKGLKKVMERVWKNLKKVKIIVSEYKLAEGYKIPSWYGVAYYDWCTSHCICYVIPLNLIVKFSRDFYYNVYGRFVKSPRYFEWEEKIYRAGYQRGQKDLADANFREILRDMGKRMSGRIKFIECGPEGIEEKSFEEVMGEEKSEEKKGLINWGEIFNAEDKSD